MSLATQITAAFSGLYDLFRADVQAAGTSIKLYDDDGTLIDTLTTGWLAVEQSQEQTDQRVMELHVTDRTGIDFDTVTQFVYGGNRYERQRFPNPPLNNPREWVWLLKPIGAEVGTLTATVWRASDTTYFAAAPDVAFKVSA